MLQVRVSYHKDGDHVLVVQVPWWHDAFEWLVINRFCACHGISGQLSRFERPGYWLHSIVNRLYGWQMKFEKELYRIPVPYGCVASGAIFGRDSMGCWREDCPIHPDEEEKE